MKYWLLLLQKGHNKEDSSIWLGWPKKGNRIVLHSVLNHKAYNFICPFCLLMLLGHKEIVAIFPAETLGKYHYLDNWTL